MQKSSRYRVMILTVMVLLLTALSFHNASDRIQAALSAIVP